MRNAPGKINGFDWDVLDARVDVIGALILRDMRTRFGRSHLGYLLAVAWPLTHLITITTIMSIANRVVPIGTEPAVFISSGVLPYILCLYPARTMGLSIETNRLLFLFPAVTPINVIIARGIIEFLTAALVVILFFIGASILGVNVLPANYSTWLVSVLSTIYFSISMGLINTVIGSIFKFWHVFFLVIMFGMYSSSGAFVLPSNLPQSTQNAMWYNPLFHCVEWIRSSYFEGYGDGNLSQFYLLSFATCLLFLGLLGERFIRGKLLFQ
ncbi:ABC transporter permease [Rhizobium terrae]|uniref:ABC transporter permease n=1 Tax=Rhizobium terrae TaxID=2171756 RepID=UPI000E3D8D2E|nr:ABC transporter permease [Rhizobium terrae]